MLSSRSSSGLPAGFVIALCVVAVFAALAHARNSLWQDNLSLWQDTAMKSSHKARPNYELGMAFGKLNRNEEAFRYITKARALDPQAVANEVMPSSDLGGDLASYHDAIEEFRNTSGTPGGGGRFDPTHQLMLVSSYFDQGKFEQAGVIIDEVLRADPANTEAYLALARIHNHFGRTDRESEAYDLAIRRGKMTKPKEIAYINQGILLGKQGRYREAVALFKEALKIRPSFEAHYNLSVTYGNMGLREEADREYRLALGMKR